MDRPVLERTESVLGRIRLVVSQRRSGPGRAANISRSNARAIPAAIAVSERRVSTDSTPVRLLSWPALGPTHETGRPAYLPRTGRKHRAPRHVAVPPKRSELHLSELHTL